MEFLSSENKSIALDILYDIQSARELPSLSQKVTDSL